MRTRDAFEVCVVGHLRPVKDPLLCARAARELSASSRVRVLHAGAALDPACADEARAEMTANARYTWLGKLSRRETLRLIARCRLLVLTSRSEGGANVVSEAVVNGVPVLSTRIEGSLGLLGGDYPGFFAVGDARELAGLLAKSESEPRFLEALARACAARAHLFRPERERSAWAALLVELERGAAP